MELMTILHEPEGKAVIDNLARGFGIDRGQAETAVARVLPQLALQLERTTLSRGGLADLIGHIGAAQQGPGHGIGLDQPQALSNPAVVEHGNGLLEHMLGGKDASRAVAAQAALSSGLSATIIQAMLPYIAQMVMSSLARRTSGGLGDILSKIPQMGGAGGAKQLPQTGGGSSFPQGSAGSSPLPGPESMQLPGRNPYGDLSDIIRRGGPAASVGGSPLWSIVRSVLGGVLGFQSRGIMGWLFRMIVLRWGWSLARSIIGRVVLGR